MKNETINDKLTMFLDMQEHPEQYTDEQIQELLADAEIRSFAKTLAASKRAMRSQMSEDVDIDAAWKQFSGTHIPTRRNWLKIAAAVSGVVFLSGMAWAAAVQLGLFGLSQKSTEMPNKPQTELSIQADTLHPDTLQMPTDTVDMAPVVFDNTPLGTVLTQMGAFYHVNIAFHNESSRKIRLYFKWDKHLGLQQQVDMLNSFDLINITLQGSNLNVE